ncbi:hypothetical protein C8R45DRAFT_352086 [Mycena sanguinolenta]|nr:hypothetical protein C8R45DRAFT_352086 [Mycena sanguinolenta]
MASSTSSSSFTKSASATFSSSPSSSLNIPDAGTGSAEPLYQVKLLSALRNGDPALIHPFLAEIGKEKRKSAGPGAAGTLGPSASSGNNNNSNISTSENSHLDTGAAALHLAIRCASRECLHSLPLVFLHVVFLRYRFTLRCEDGIGIRRASRGGVRPHRGSHKAAIMIFVGARGRSILAFVAGFQVHAQAGGRAD